MGQHRTRREILIARWHGGVEAARELMRDGLRRPVVDPLEADWSELHGEALQLAADIDAAGRRLIEFGSGEPAAPERVELSGPPTYYDDASRTGD